MIRAACLGECMVELRPAGDGLYARSCAGDAYNTAVYLRRSLGEAADVAFVTALGDDGASRDMAAAFAAEGVAARWAFPVPGGAPGLYMIELDARGERSFLYWRSASAARGWWRELKARGGADLLAGLDLVYLSGVSLAILPPQDRLEALDLLRALKGRVGRTAFDPNIRPRLWRDMAEAADAVAAATACADIVLPSAQDGELLWGETDPDRQLALWRGAGAAEVALTLAADGCRVVWPGGEAAAPAPACTVVDTSGGGDSFNGAYLAERLAGGSPEAAARAGVALAAMVVASPGAITPAARAPNGAAVPT